MTVLIKIIQVIISLGLLIILHEGGHFLFAKLFKTRVNKFYLFFDYKFHLFSTYDNWFRRLFGKKPVPKKDDGEYEYQGTEYGIGWIPLGGYVAIDGMIDETQSKEKLKAEHSFIFSVSQLDPIANTTDKYDKDMGDHSMVIIEPPSLDQRIISQYSYFSIIPDGIRDIEKFLDDNTENTVCYVIDKHVRWDIRDMLDQFNISERVLYPGLDGLSKWIARHYYVMDSLYEEETGLKD